MHLVAPDDHSLFTIHYLPVVLPFLFLLLRSYSYLKIIELVCNITIANVYSVDFRKHSDGARQVTHLFIGRTEFILHRLIFFRRTSGSVEAFFKPKDRRLRHALLHKAMAQHITTLKISRSTIGGSGKAGRCLEFGYGLVEEGHLPV